MKTEVRKVVRRKCWVCGELTEYGCPDCRAVVCNPYTRDCYWVHQRRAGH